MRGAVPVRRLRASRLVLAFACLGLLAAFFVQLTRTHRQMQVLRQELSWTQARLAEKRTMIRLQRAEIAQLAAGVDRAARATADAREGYATLRRLAKLEESREPETSPLQQVSMPDFGAVLISESTGHALEQLAWLEGQTAAMKDSVHLLTTLVATGPAGGGRPVALARRGCGVVGIRGSSLAMGWIVALPRRSRPARLARHASLVGGRRDGGFFRAHARLRQHGRRRPRLRIEDALRTPVIDRRRSGAAGDGRRVPRRCRLHGAFHGSPPPLRGPRRRRTGRSHVLPRRRRPSGPPARVDRRGVGGYISTSAATCRKWGRSSVGRALEWHSRGREFDPPRLHSTSPAILIP